MPMRQGDRVCLKCGGVNGHEPGYSDENEQVFDVISAYSRAQAIEDGVLVDCSQPPFDELNGAVGIKVHVAMTVEVFHAYVHPLGRHFPVKTPQQDGKWQLSTEHQHLPAGQSMVGRYWDIIWRLRFAMQSSKDSSCVTFALRVIPNSGGAPENARLKCIAGSNDEGNVCLTIMLPDQD